MTRASTTIGPIARRATAPPSTHQHGRLCAACTTARPTTRSSSATGCWFGISGVFILIGLTASCIQGGLNFGIELHRRHPVGGPRQRRHRRPRPRTPSRSTGFSEVEVQEVGDDCGSQTQTLEGTDAERRDRNGEVIDTLDRAHRGRAERRSWSTQRRAVVGRGDLPTRPSRPSWCS